MAHVLLGIMCSMYYLQRAADPQAKGMFAVEFDGRFCSTFAIACARSGRRYIPTSVNHTTVICNASPEQQERV